MDVDECIMAYIKFTKIIFDNPQNGAYPAFLVRLSPNSIPTSSRVQPKKSSIAIELSRPIYSIIKLTQVAGCKCI